MKVRKTIFDSAIERNVFKSLNSRWSSRLVLYPQLPLSKIIELNREKLTPQERSFFFRTNLDYTFCDNINHPILSVEFDGIGGGFSKNGVCFQTRKTIDPMRKRKMDFKLRLANAVSYPLVVISYEEIESIDEEDSFTILDGIIGQHLAKIETGRLLEEWWKENEDWIQEHPEWEKRELIQDQVASVEVDAEFMHDPIAVQASRYEYLCGEYARRHMGSKNQNLEYVISHLCDPPLPDLTGTDPFVDIKGLEARAEAMKHTIREGCRAVVKTPKVAVVNIIWVRNFSGIGVYPYFIAENIAKYLAFKRAYKMLARGRI